MKKLYIAIFEAQGSRLVLSRAYPSLKRAVKALEHQAEGLSFNTRGIVKEFNMDSCEAAKEVLTIAL